MADERDPENREPASMPSTLPPAAVAAPPSPSNIASKPRPPAVAIAAEDDEESDRKIPNCIWVSLQVLLTAVACSPLLALALTRTEGAEKGVLCLVMLPLVAGVFCLLRAACDRPSLAVVAYVVNKR